MNNLNNINISNSLNITWISIYNYFIDNKITINDDDNYTLKFKKFLLKYKRIIGVVLLIILLIIGYYEYNDNYNKYSYNININKKQDGGADDEPLYTSKAEALAHVQAKSASDTFKMEAKKAHAEATAKSALDEKASKGFKVYRKEEIEANKEKKDRAKTSMKAKKIEGSHNIKKLGAKISSAVTTRQGAKNALKSAGKGIYNIGASGAQVVREKADWFYGFLYSIALSLVICIITIPSIGFFIIGIFCYFLLKDKISGLKGL